MRRTFIFPLLAAAAIVALPALAADQARTVPSFTSISNSGPISLAIEVGKTQSLVASGSDTFLEKLSTEVVDGQLRIKLKDKSLGSTWGDPKVVITMPRLTRLEIAGAGDTTLVHMSGDSLDVRFTGVGSLKAEGTVKSLTLNVGGVGSIDTRSLHADSVNVNVGGVGSVRVYASTRLDAAVGGVGSLTYYGDPKTVNTNGGGLGSISRGR
jgi:hypothetical protein